MISAEYVNNNDLSIDAQEQDPITFTLEDVTINTSGITPEGNINITGTSQVNVTTYATAQVVDSDLTAANIKKDVDILGVTGTYEGDEVPTDEFGLPLKDTGYDWHTNNALYLVFDNEIQPDSLSSSYYGAGYGTVGSNMNITVGTMEGSVYVPKKTISNTSNAGLMSEFEDRWVIVRIIGDVNTFYGSPSPCWVSVYGHMPTLTIINRITQNNCQYTVKSYELEGAIDIGNYSPGMQDLCSLKRLSIEFGGNMGVFGNFLKGSYVLQSLSLTLPDSNVIGSLSYAFQNVRFLESIDFSGWDVSSVKSSAIVGFLQNMSNLKTLNLDGWDLALVTSTPSYFFSGLPSLTNFTSPKFYCSVSFTQSTLTHDSLMSIINNLATVSTSPKLTLGSTNLAKLTDEEKAIATSKGWTLA